MYNIKDYGKACLLGACSILPAVTLSARKNEVPRTKPNIVVFIADDAGMDFGCYGNRAISTPNIDKLAASGLRFENAFLTAPQSSPSRTSMMTGKFPHTLGTEDLHEGLGPEQKTIPGYLNEAGYETAVMLKTHWGVNGDRQFSRILKAGYLPDQGPLTQTTWDSYDEFLDSNQDNPFFLWVGFVDPHRPDNRNNCTRINNPDKIDIPPFLVDDSETGRDLADYYDEISRMDGDIGRMVRELEKRGIIDNTIIIFLSDNGRPFPRCKGTLYDTGIQTPLVVVWNGVVRPGSVHSNGLVSTVDLAPTILDMAGIDKPVDMYGESFVRLMRNPSERGCDYIFAERNWHDTDEYIRCVRTENLKLIYNAYYDIPHGTPMDVSTSDSWYSLKAAQREGKLTREQRLLFECPRAMVEIYDLERDPMELNNVADRPEYLERGKRLARLLADWQKQTGDHPSWQRRRADQNDRITGFPLLQSRPPRLPE